MEDKYLMYQTSSGKSGYQRMRLKEVRIQEDPHLLALKLEQLTEGEGNAIVVSPAEGISITVARMLEVGGLEFAPYRYAVIYEADTPETYAVFYVGKGGDIMWITGPKKRTFERVWNEFNRTLQAAAA